MFKVFSIMKLKTRKRRSSSVFIGAIVIAMSFLLMTSGNIAASPLYNAPYIIDDFGDIYRLNANGTIAEYISRVVLPMDLQDQDHFVQDIAFRGRTLYGITHGTTGIDDVSRIVKIDFYTGASEILNIDVKTIDGHASSFDTTFPKSLTMNPLDGMLYGVGEMLYRIDVGTNTATQIDRFHTNGSNQWSMGGLAFDTDGTLYATVREHGGSQIFLAAVDPLTAELELIRALQGVDNFDTVAIEHINGAIWGAASTGEYKLIGARQGPDPVGDFLWVDAAINNNGLTMLGMSKPFDPVPEPATLVLFGSGIMGLAFIIRRRIEL